MQNKKLKFLLYSFLFILNHSLTGSVETSLKFKGIYSIGEFNFIERSLQECYLIDKHGMGAYEHIWTKRSNQIKCMDERGYCNHPIFYFYKTEENIFVKFFIIKNDCLLVSILVSTIPLRKKYVLPKKEFKNFITLEGLKLGDNYNKVISIYGKPDIIKKKHFSDNKELNDIADTALAYLNLTNSYNSLLSSTIYLKNNIVIAIFVSVSP